MIKENAHFAQSELKEYLLNRMKVKGIEVII